MNINCLENAEGNQVGEGGRGRAFGMTRNAKCKSTMVEIVFSWGKELAENEDTLWCTALNIGLRERFLWERLVE